MVLWKEGSGYSGDFFGLVKFADISQPIWWVQPIGWNEPTFEEHGAWLLWGKKNRLMTITIVLVVLVILPRRNSRGFYFQLTSFRLPKMWISTCFFPAKTPKISTKWAGQSQEAVKDRLGHKSIKSTDIYAKISSHKRDMISREMERAREIVSLNEYPIFERCQQGPSLKNMLKNISELYDTHVDTKISGLSTIIEPALMIGIGIVVVIVILVLYLPIFKYG